MANEIQFSNSQNRTLTEVLNGFFTLIYADRDILFNHQALIKIDDPTPGGSTTVQVPEVGWMGFDQLTAVAEGAAIGNTALTEQESLISVGRYGKRYEHSELAKMTDVYGLLDPQSFAQDAVVSGGMTLTNLIAGLMGGFSSTVGATGVNLSVQNWYDAITTLELANVKGRYLADIHGRQYADLRDALRAETGVIEHMEATEAQMETRSSAFKGSVGGVDIFASNQVPTANAGADRAGGMFGRGAILWADAQIMPNPAVAFQIIAGRMSINFAYDDRRAMTGATTNYYLGVTEGQDAGGVAIITDA